MQPKKLLHSKSCDDDMNVPKVTLANGSLCTSHKTRLFPPHNNNYSKNIITTKNIAYYCTMM